MSIAENIQTMQAFVGHFNPAQAEQMARGCRVPASAIVESTGADHAASLKDYVADERLLHALLALQDALLALAEAPTPSARRFPSQ